jgi:sensor histidine kinase regulating citrate/malate metabolism
MLVVLPLLSHGASWRRIYLQGIDPEEIITAVRTRRAPMMSASAGLKL